MMAVIAAPAGQDPVTRGFKQGNLRRRRAGQEIVSSFPHDQASRLFDRYQNFIVTHHVESLSCS